MIYKIERIFIFIILLISISFISIALYSTYFSTTKTVSENSNKISKEIYINNFNKSFVFNLNIEKNNITNIEQLKFKTKLQGLDDIDLLYSYPRIIKNYNMKKDYLKKVYTRYEWEIPNNYFNKYSNGKPLDNYLFRNDNSIYPGAPRYYRHGIHRGIDFSDRRNNTKAGRNEPLYAVEDGTIMKIKDDYKMFSEEDKFDKYRELCSSVFHTSDELLNFFRGNQLYVKSNDKYYIYSHINKFAKNLKVGKQIKKGDIIAYMGNSGVEYMNVRNHLHLEIYFGDFIVGINRYRRKFKETLKIYKNMFKYKY